MTERQRRSIIDEAESTLAGAIEMAAADAEVCALDLLNRAHEASGSTQRSLADLFKVTPGRISQILGGDSQLRVASVARLLRASGYTLSLRAEPVAADLPEINPKPRRRRTVVEPEAAAPPSADLPHVVPGTVMAAGPEGVGEHPVVVVSWVEPTAFLTPVTMNTQSRASSLLNASESRQSRTRLKLEVTPR